MTSRHTVTNLGSMNTLAKMRVALTRSAFLEIDMPPALTSTLTEMQFVRKYLFKSSAYDCPSWSR
jgi:hypothetical protein